MDCTVFQTTFECGDLCCQRHPPIHVFSWHNICMYALPRPLLPFRSATGCNSRTWRYSKHIVKATKSFQKYEAQSYILFWDRKWLYIASYFLALAEAVNLLWSTKGNHEVDKMSRSICASVWLLLRLSPSTVSNQTIWRQPRRGLQRVSCLHRRNINLRIMLRKEWASLRRWNRSINAQYLTDSTGELGS